MNIKPTTQKFRDADIRLLVVFTGEKKKDRYMQAEGVTAVDPALGGHLSAMLGDEKFKGEPRETLTVSTHGRIRAARVIVAGLGDPKKLTYAVLRDTVARCAQDIRKLQASRIGFLLPNELLDVLGGGRTAQGITEGLHLSLYEFTRLKKPVSDLYALKDVMLFVYPTRLDSVTSGIHKGSVVSKAVSYARDLVNEPPSLTTPSYLAKEAEKLAKSSDRITAEVFGKAEMRTMGMGGILGIAQGSDEEPKFIRLDYKGGGSAGTVIVGKGITFDTGGLSIKPSGGMETMKLDMAGGAAILAVFRALSELKPKLTVTGLIAATENMPSGRAIKPGDVVRAMNGKTIEILNTDAEGRVVLADALSYAGAKLKPSVIIDLATLTGACMVALGEDVAGLFSNDSGLRDRLLEASGRAGEEIWPMPLVEGYREQVKSHVADVKNITKSRYGGAITAALFLEEFVPEKVAWAHLDIAGPAFAEKNMPITPLGGTGFGVQTVLEYLLGKS